MFNSKYLPKSDVVFSVMFLDKKLCEKTLSAVTGENINLIDIVTEAKNDLHKAALNSIYFDVRTKAKDGRIITLDLQRKYIRDRVRNRTVYYACREIAQQEVIKGKYEALKNVIVTFLLTEATLKTTTDNSKIQLYNAVTGDKYSDLLTIYEVNIKHISESNKNEMVILKAFFEIDNENKFNLFKKNYGNTEFGSLLLDRYSLAISDIGFLLKLEGSDKFMNRLTDEERLEERLEGKQEGKKEGLKETAKNMLKMGMDISTITKATGLLEDEIKNLL